MRSGRCGTYGIPYTEYSSLDFASHFSLFSNSNAKVAHVLKGQTRKCCTPSHSGALCERSCY